MPEKRDEHKAAIMIPFLEEFGITASISSSKGKFILVGLLLLSWLCLIMALAKPVWIGDAVALPMSARNVLLAVDLSGSMEQRDFRVGGTRVSRLAATKKVAVDFIKRRGSDRIALILFGDNAYLQVPLTRDLDTVTKLLNEALLGLAGERTALGDAIGLAIKKVQEHPDQEHVLVLMTDGAATAGADVKEATRIAVETGLKIYTVGIGSVSSDITKKRSDLDEETLESIANETGGYYFRARSTQEFEDIYKKLDELEPITDTSEAWRPVTDLFYWPLAVAGMALLLLFMLREKQAHE